MAMAQEENAQKCSNSSGGGGSSKSSKKMKPKKVPQRGLGVAQLEKIRVEEQRRRDNNSFRATNSILSPNNSMVSPMNSLTSLQISQSPSVLVPNISRHDLASPSSAFRASPSNPTGSSFSKQLNRPGLIMPHWPKLWNGEYNLDGEDQRLDHHGITFRHNINSPVESHTSVLPFPSALQRSQQYQHSGSSSMVNILSGISPSSVRNFQIEPPSNQNYRANDYTPLWPEEVKIIGVKRPYPFSPEYPLVPSFNCKFPPGYVSSTSREKEPTSCSNGSIVNVESRNPLIRDDWESISNSSALLESNSRSLNQEKQGISGDFLTLAPPAASSPQIDPRYQHRSRNLLHHIQEASCQRGGEELIKRSGMFGSDQPQIFSFFPAAKVQSDHEKSPKRSCKSDTNAVVDLNLRL